MMFAAQPEYVPKPEPERKPEEPERRPEFEEQKSRMAAGVLSILLGWIGAGRFYLGYPGLGILQIVLTLLTGIGGAIWGIIDGILILTGSINTDADGVPLRD